MPIHTCSIRSQKVCKIEFEIHTSVTTFAAKIQIETFLVFFRHYENCGNHKIPSM